MSIPLQQNCDPNDPEEMFLWCLNALPGLEEQAPMLVPPQVARKWSRRLHDLGLRWDPTLQLLKYVPPTDQYHWLAGSGGRWVPIETDLGPEDTAPSLDHLSTAEKRKIAERLMAEGYIPQPVQGPEQDVAEVENVGDRSDQTSTD